ncbi:MAG: hypothetical protein FK733_03090 [Asgard group archaeon]|nr:hypothetical protein [Asgard group archaeon]
MAVIEAGLIVNGMPQIQSIYYPEDYVVDPIVKSNLVAAIQVMAESAFRDEAREIKLKKYAIFINSIKHETVGQLFLYAIAEIAKTDLNEVQRRIDNLGKDLDFTQITLDLPMKTKKLISIQQRIDKSLKDLCMKPADRAKAIFG